ncbi:MAG: hypothetical protein DMF73_20250 [Acidobacteria bacterium]|nr:MAG: hypothetical protein DMF73_20250 [Acidobacteriota bacterium]
MTAGREGSELIAKQTGGFLVRNSNDFGLKKIAEDQNGYYLLGYRPTDETFNRKFHHLKVAVKGRGLTVRTREGFFGVGEESEQRGELTAVDQLKKALMILPCGSRRYSRISTMDRCCARYFTSRRRIWCLSTNQAGDIKRCLIWE